MQETSSRSTGREILIEELRWRKFPQLSDGFVCLVDCMGDDAAICQAARVSYGAGTRSVSDDRTLIRYLMRQRHTSPFEQAELKFLVRVPMDCWRQWIRHRMSSTNEYSTRYSEAIDSCDKTPLGGWREQSTTNRQGSEGEITREGQIGLCKDEEDFHKHAIGLYKSRIAMGVAREQARKDLPLSTYTEAYWKVDLHNLLHFLGLRMDAHAQLEIRQYATTIGEQIVAPLFPLTWQAFLDYRLNAMSLTAIEIEMVRKIISHKQSEAAALTYQPDDWKSLEKCRERDEAIAKLKRIGLIT
jgi:thymidylate synthase (FAD)